MSALSSIADVDPLANKNENPVAKAPNIAEDMTPLMRRIQDTCEITVRGRLEELLAEKRQCAIPESDITRLVTEDLKGNINSTRHLMGDLRWTKKKVKWGGKNYVRAIWVKPEYHVEGGKIFGPDGYEQDLTEHLKDPTEERIYGRDFTSEGPAAKEEPY